MSISTFTPTSTPTVSTGITASTYIHLHPHIATVHIPASLVHLHLYHT